MNKQEAQLAIKAIYKMYCKDEIGDNTYQTLIEFINKIKEK